MVKCFLTDDTQQVERIENGTDSQRVGRVVGSFLTRSALEAERISHGGWTYRHSKETPNFHQRDFSRVNQSKSNLKNVSNSIHCVNSEISPRVSAAVNSMLSLLSLYLIFLSSCFELCELGRLKSSLHFDIPSVVMGGLDHLNHVVVVYSRSLRFPLRNQRLNTHIPWRIRERFLSTCSHRWWANRLGDDILGGRRYQQ